MRSSLTPQQHSAAPRSGHWILPPAWNAHPAPSPPSSARPPRHHSLLEGPFRLHLRCLLAPGGSRLPLGPRLPLAELMCRFQRYHVCICHHHMLPGSESLWGAAGPGLAQSDRQGTKRAVAGDTEIEDRFQPSCLTALDARRKHL